jgi:hypothetical protein
MLAVRPQPHFLDTGRWAPRAGNRASNFTRATDRPAHVVFAKR